MTDSDSDSQSIANDEKDFYDIDETVLQLSQNHPLYLHPNDHPGMKIVSQLLTELNYAQWSRSVLISLSAKMKLGMIDGTCIKPSSKSKYITVWNRCNDMVISWLLNALSPDIASSVVYVKSAKEIWEYLRSRYSQANAPKIFRIQQEMSAFTQGHLAISMYHTKFKSMWDEYETLVTFPKCICSCECGAVKAQEEFEAMQKLTRFLMGLNDGFTQIRGQILIRKPLPTIDEALNILLQEEHQRGHSNSGVQSVINTEDVTTALFNKGYASQYKPNLVKGKTRGQYFCDYCHGDSHTRDKCFYLLGYPDWHRLYGTKPDVTRMPKNFGRFGQSTQGIQAHNVISDQIGNTASANNTNTTAGNTSGGNGTPMLTAAQISQLMNILGNTSGSANCSNSMLDSPEAHLSVINQDEDKKPADQSGGGAHIILKVILFQGQDGNEMFFRIKRNTQLKKLMYAYCDQQPVEIGAFMFDGRRLRGEQTPDELEMEDGDEIFAMLPLRG